MDEQHARIDRDTWPEHIYRYVEHYFWEPQHLIKTGSSRLGTIARGERSIDAFYRLIRSHEVPLNLLMNLFLRVAPSRVRTNLLRLFVPGGSQLQGRMELLFAEDQTYTQPDLLLESETERVLIEMKVDASLDLQQVEKYVVLHAATNRTVCQKRPFLLFLTRDTVSKHWKPRSAEHEIAGQGVERYLQRELVSSSIAPALLKRARVSAAELSKLLAQLKIGETTWQRVGSTIALEAKDIAQAGGELAEVFGTLATDFLSDLGRRGLWSESHMGES